MAKKTIKEEVAEVLNQEEECEKDHGFYLSTSCTLLNVALSGKADGGIKPGMIVNPAGYSHAGKSLLAMSMLAEAASNPNFDEYELHMQDTENGSLFDVVKYFGKKLDKRIIKTIDNSMEGFFTKLTEMTDKGKKFIYVIDSYDGLMCAADRTRRKDIQDAYNSDKEFKYQDFPRRAAFGHELCRNMVSDIAKTGSIIINLSQTKDKMNATMFEDKRRRAGGTALDYYTHVMFWLDKGATEKEKFGNVVIRNGHWVNFDIAKNRINGRSSKLKLFVRPEYGIDDVVSSIDFLDSIDAIQKEKRSYVIQEWGFKGTKDSLITFIEENNKESDFAKMVEVAWNDMVNKMDNKVVRKKRYE